MVDVNVDFIIEPDVTYTADILLSSASSFHNELFNRDLPDQHPMSAITGLEDALEGLSDDITAENNRAIEAEEALDDKIDLEETRAKGVEQDLASSIDSNHQAISDHVSDKNNPHEVTKAQVGLGNVANLAPADMPMSTATKTYVDNADTVLQGQINTINTTIGGYGNIVTHNVSEFATASQGALADTALQPNDNISELTNNLNYQTATQVANSIAVETSNRENADINLQSQIDAIVSASDVFDIVGTYAELQAYDISTVPVNDIIKVLVDSTHAGAATYYRCVETGGVKSWSYIGSEGAYYTKAEADSNFVPQTRTVNNKALSNDITLTANDVGALPSSTSIPTATSDLVNDSGFITSSALTGYATENYVDTGLATKQNTLVSGTNIKTINNETVLGSGNIDIQSSTVAFGTSSTAGNVAEKEVSIPEITELNVGQILYIKPSNSATVANLTIKLNNFTAYPIRYNNGAITTTTDDLVWSQNYVSTFVFDGTYWQFAGRGYDKDTTYTQNILFDRGNFVSGSGTYAISRYSICLQKPDMTWEKVTNTEDDYSLATDKTVNTHGFLLNGEMLYYSNTAVLANGAASSANTMYRQNSGFDIRYSMNTIGTGYTAGDYIYLVGTIGVDGLFYLDSTQWWTNTLPSTNDGKIYVKVGKYVSGVTITLELEHPAYYHDGTKIRIYQSASNKQDTLVSGTNIKTINNQSLLGSGNITISGGGGGGAVDSVNGYTGVVVLTASDVGALATSDVTEYTAAEVETLWGSI